MNCSQILPIAYYFKSAGLRYFKKLSMKNMNFNLFWNFNMTFEIILKF